MKTLYSKEYYQLKREDLFKKYGKYCDYEKKLTLSIPENLPEKAIPIVESMRAKEIADSAKKELVEKRERIRKIMNGEISLGMTTERQEIHELHNLQEGFEFSCYMLAEFKKRHNIT